MNELTFEERNLVCIYNGGGTASRVGTISALCEMRAYLRPDERELKELTDSAIGKLANMTDEDYAALDLFPDFDMEGNNAE